jgi:threonine dehydratase
MSEQSAFPYTEHCREGMTLRDYFAAKAMQALLTRETRISEDAMLYAGAAYDVADAMILLMERGKLLVEGGGAVGVSALMRGLVSPASHGTTCVVLSGGNVDMGLIPGLIRRHETQAGRRLIVFVRISDRPGGLAQLLSLFAENGANLVEVEHVREGVDLHVRETGVQIVLETRGPEHAATVLAAARSGGYEISELTR